MSKAVQTRIIGGETFLITKLGVEDSLKVLLWLTKSLGGSLANGLGEFQSLAEVGGGEDVDLSKFAGAIEKLFNTIDEKETLQKIEILLSCVTGDKDTQPLSFNHSTLQGEPLLALKLAKESMGVNFKDFLGGISGVADKLKASVKIIQGDQT